MDGAAEAAGDVSNLWRFKVMFPGKPRPVWVACGAEEKVAVLRKAISEKGNLPLDKVVLVVDDAELDIVDMVRVVLKNETVITVELN